MGQEQGEGVCEFPLPMSIRDPGASPCTSGFTWLWSGLACGGCEGDGGSNENSFGHCRMWVLLLCGASLFLEVFVQMVGEGVGSPQCFEMAMASLFILFIVTSSSSPPPLVCAKPIQ